MKFAAAVLGALYLPAVAADQWVVAPPAKDAKVAPTFLVIPGRSSETWPMDYALAKVGAKCGAAIEGERDMRLVLGRKGTAARCEVKK